MGNYPKKLTDPTEVALSAIQEALNVNEDEEQPTERSNGMSSGLRSPEFSLCSNPTASLSSFIRKGRHAKAIKAKILLKISLLTEISNNSGSISSG